MASSYHDLEEAMANLTAILGDDVEIPHSLNSSVINLPSLHLAPEIKEGPTPVSLAAWVSLVVFMLHAWPDKAMGIAPALYIGGNKSDQHPITPEIVKVLEEGVERFYPQGVVVEQCINDPEPRLMTESGQVTKMSQAKLIPGSSIIYTRQVWRVLTGGEEDAFVVVQCQWPDSSPMKILLSSLNELVWKPLKALQAFQMTMGWGGEVRVKPRTFKRGFFWKKPRSGSRFLSW